MPKLKRKSQDATRECNKAIKRAKLENESYRLTSIERTLQCMRSLRENKEYRAEENQKNSENMQKRREDEEYRAEEKKRDLEQKKKLRTDEAFKDAERKKDKENKRKLRSLNNWSDCESQFSEKIKFGPTNVCCCCDGLWFIDSVRFIKREVFDKKTECLSFIYLINKHSECQVLTFCNTC